MLKLSIIHYLALSLATCPSPKSILNGLTSCPGFVDFCREKGCHWGYRKPENAIATHVANEDKNQFSRFRGVVLCRGVFGVKILPIQRGIFVLCMLVYVKCFSYLCSGLMRREDRTPSIPLRGGGEAERGQ